MTAESAPNTGRGGMTAARRAKLEQIQKREELKDALKHKLLEQYKEKKTARGQQTVNEAITKEIDTFINVSKVTQENIGKLERNVGRKVAGVCGEANEDDKMSVYSIGSQVPKTVRQQYQDAVRTNVEVGALGITGTGLGAIPEEEPVETPAPAKSTIESEIEAMYAPDNLTWAAVDQYSAMLHDRDSQGNWGGKIASQMALRETLDKQVSDKATRISKESRDGDKYYDQMIADIALHKQQEEDKIAERKEKNLKEKNDRQKQIELEAERREVKKAANMREEEAMVQKCMTDLKKEAAAQQHKKEQQQKMMQQLQADNIKDQAAKKVQAEADRIAEQKAQEQYAEMVKKQEADRKAALEARQAKQAVLLKRMQDTVGAQSKDASEKEANTANAQAEEAHQRAAQIHMAKAKARQEMNAQYSDFLKKQMNEKVVRKEYAAQLKQLCAQIMENDQKKHEEEQGLLSIENAMMWAKHKEELTRQMEEKANRVILKDGELTDAEYKLNKPLLNTVSEYLIAHHKEKAMRESEVGAQEEEA